MDLYSELKRNKQKFESNEISREEYNQRQISILNKWSSELKNHSHGKEQKKARLSCYALIPFNAIVDNKSKEINLYGILHLTPSATEADIKSKYKKLALKYHPDKNGSAKIEEWINLSKAYQTLSDKNSRALYDNFGTVYSNTFMDKASFNCYVGGEFWKPYIGNLEIGLWLFSFMDSELGYVMSAEQKKRRHDTRVFSIVRYLQDKLSQFPKHDDGSFERSLFQEAQRLLVEPNGKELLSLLGDIYISEAKAHLRKEGISRKFSFITSNFRFFEGLTYLAMGKEMNQEKIQNATWKLSLSEITSIAHETCEKVLKEYEYNKEKSYLLAHSLFLLGNVWKETSKQLVIIDI